MAFFKYGATVNIKKQASLDIIAKDVPEVSHTADKISAKKDDNFVYFWTRAVSADVPNLNSDLFPLDELKKAYPTFIGRGLYMDHNAQSVANAVGKVFDAKLLEDPTATDEEGRYYVGCLCGVDKTTHPDIAAKVAHGVIDSVSMGASCGSCECGICHRVCHTPEEFCAHLQHQGQIDPETGKKCISINRDVNFSELSLVGVPADPMAKMQQVFAEFVGGLNKSASLEKEAENSFLEKFSFSIPCGNEKICETLFNVLTGYKKQGISDLSMDGSILKLSVEAKNEDLAKQKLEKISEEQGLGVEQPLEKEENLMPKEEIKPVKDVEETKEEKVASKEVKADIEEDEPTVSPEAIKRYKEHGFVEKGTPDYDEFYNAGFTLKKSFVGEEDGKDLYNVVEFERMLRSSKKEYIIKKAYGNMRDLSYPEDFEITETPQDEQYFITLNGRPAKVVSIIDTIPNEDAREEAWHEIYQGYNESFPNGSGAGADAAYANFMAYNSSRYSKCVDLESGKTFEIGWYNQDGDFVDPLDNIHTDSQYISLEELKEKFPDFVDPMWENWEEYKNNNSDKVQNKSYSQEVESSKTQLNEVKEVKAEENKETKKEDLVPGVSKEDTKKDIKHDLAKEKEEAKGGEDETKDIETLEKAIKETDKGALSKVIDLLKKFIGGEAKEGEDLKDYKSDDLVKKLEEKPADKKASLEEPVNNVVNTVAEPVMDHIEAKPEVPAQPVPEVKEEVGEKKEEMKPSKDVKTKEDAVKVLEDVLKAGEEADVKELGKVLDFLKSDKKEEKKEEVKEEKVEEKAEPKKEEPVKEEKKAKVEEPLEVEAQPSKLNEEEMKQVTEMAGFISDQSKDEQKRSLIDAAEHLGFDTERIKATFGDYDTTQFGIATKPEAKCEAEVKEEVKPLFANVIRVSLLKTANLIDSKWVFHFKGTDKVACLSVKNLLPGVSEKVAYLTSKEFYNEMMDTLTKKQAFDGEAVKQIVANYNEKIKVGSDEAKSQVSKATSKAKNETDGKKVSDTSKAVDTKLTDDGKAQKQDKVNSKEDAGAVESATKKAPAETDIKVSAELEAKCKQLTAALEAKEAEVSQMKMQQELAAKTAKARQIVEKSIKCGLVQCNETFRQEELLKQASPLKAKEEAMKRTADSMVADLLALSDEELDKQASYLSNFKVEAEVKQLKPIKIEASCEQSEDEDLIKALGAEMW